MQVMDKSSLAMVQYLHHAAINFYTHVTFANHGTFEQDHCGLMVQSSLRY